MDSKAELRKRRQKIIKRMNITAFQKCDLELFFENYDPRWSDNGNKDPFFRVRRADTETAIEKLIEINKIWRTL
jgi:hypothetical protein